MNRNSASAVGEVDRNSSARIPCLDGLRAMSIAAVLLAHLNGTRGFPASSWWLFAGDLGNLGVRCFFVISGFLITHLLLRELRKNGNISLKNFYVRRTFRIFPAFYTFLVCVALLSWLGIIVVKTADFGYSATYSINFIEKKSWAVGHLWSLSVEEQFYLLWPLCLVAAGLSRAKKIAIGTVVLVPILRTIAWYWLPEYQGILAKAFPTICDAIATGCLLACFRDRLGANERYRAFLSSGWFILVPLAVMLSNALASHTRPDLLLGQSVRNVGIALCVDWCLRNSCSRVGKWLNLPPIVWLGTLSYSLYLWQQLFLNRGASSGFCAFPQNLILALLCAALSYYAVERPWLKMRARLFESASARERSISQVVAGGAV